MSARYVIDSADAPGRLLLAAVVVILAGCEVYATAPPCPFQVDPVRAPSAGCFTVEGGKLLVVQHGNGKVTPPGGSAHIGESAQCAAYRETWEETGLSIIPGTLLGVFDTGFHLYQCERAPDSGGVDPPTHVEVQAAFFLAPSEFDKWEWRFEGQQEILRDLMERVTAPQQ